MIQFTSVAQSCLTLWLHELQHARPPCPSPTPRVYPNSCPLSWWCHLTISSSVVPCSSCLQSFPTSESFQMSQLFAWGGQNIGVSASASLLPMNTQVISFRMDWMDLLAVQGTLKGLLQKKKKKESSPTPQFKIINSSALRFLYTPTLTSIHDYWKDHSLDNTSVGKVVSLLFNTLSRFAMLSCQDAVIF